MDRVAVIGMVFRFPGGAESEKKLWDALVSGDDLVSEIDGSRWAVDTLQHPKRSEPGRSITFSAGVLSRIDEAHQQDVPITNYGITIAKLSGILDSIALPAPR